MNHFDHVVDLQGVSAADSRVHSGTMMSFPQEPWLSTLQQRLVTDASLALHLCQQSIKDAHHRLHVALDTCTLECDGAKQQMALQQAEQAVQVAAHRLDLAKRLAALSTKQPEHQRDKHTIAEGGEEVTSTLRPLQAN